MFTPEQIKALEAPLDRKYVKPPPKGRFGDYVEGWHCIAEANRIFGFDGWTRETTLTHLSEQQAGDRWVVNYGAKVRITVGPVFRDGCGFGQGIDRDLGRAHESALKEAETDAMKRALMTFGNPFGLALYDKKQENVSDGPPSPQEAPGVARPHFPVSGSQNGVKRLTSAEAKRVQIDKKFWDLVNDAKTEEALDIIENQFDTLTAAYPLSWLDAARNHILNRRGELQGEQAHEALDAEYSAIVGGPDPRLDPPMQPGGMRAL